MYAGRIVEEGPTQAVLDAPAHPYTRRLIACVPILGSGKRALRRDPRLPPAVDALPDVGCAFAPRCTRANRRLPRGRDPAISVADGRAARCLYAYDDDARGGCRAIKGGHEKEWVENGKANYARISKRPSLGDQEDLGQDLPCAGRLLAWVAASISRRCTPCRTSYPFIVAPARRLGIRRRIGARQVSPSRRI